MDRSVLRGQPDSTMMNENARYLLTYGEGMSLLNAEDVRMNVLGFPILQSSNGWEFWPPALDGWLRLICSEVSHVKG